ncbi:hypothetical protein HOY34_04750 [Xinfangfangia sp. D13-10-4-6]|uniref:hypothetical protein n=1 Tax=Pseudogemmobacter hezensis TaxID=2737662 RepID=UPI001551682B|nr:hypothetical protein [Pseudogemmobacter hezensis]NPD14509.1 hypothetical protein [Pseudogemmobacter hezensis]
MSTPITLTRTRIRAGIWEGILAGSGETPPQLEVTLDGQVVPGHALTKIPGRAGEYLVKVPVPAEALSEGVQTFLIRRKGGPSEPVLAHFTIITGVAMEDDLRAEFDLLRAELDMLKRAFRRHCLETAEQA